MWYATPFYGEEHNIPNGKEWSDQPWFRSTYQWPEELLEFVNGARGEIRRKGFKASRHCQDQTYGKVGLC